MISTNNIQSVATVASSCALVSETFDCKESSMTKFTDSLRGYAYEILKRDGFKCRYCGLEGSKDFDSWLALSWDHLLPKGHPERDNPDFIVAACNFCNGADNKYFDMARQRGLSFDGLSQEQLHRAAQTFC